MGRQVLPLTVERWPLLIEPCSTCLFWERTPAQNCRPAVDPLGVKRDWIRSVLQEWGSPGRIALVDDAPAGYVTYAPAHLVPNAMAFPTAPVSEDAIALITARIASDFAGQGLGRMLVQRAAKDALRHGVRAIEVFATTASHRAEQAPSNDGAHADGRRSHGGADSADAQSVSTRRYPSGGPGEDATVEVSVGAAQGPDRSRRHDVGDPMRPETLGRIDGPASADLRRRERTLVTDGWELPVCLLPVDFLTAVGFHPVREHPRFPRMRLDLRTALRWREGIGLAVERLFTPARSLGGRHPVGSVN